jgi:hypothetical protein
VLFRIQTIVRRWIKNPSVLRGILDFPSSIPRLPDSDRVISSFNTGFFAKRILEELDDEKEYGSVFPIPIHLSADGFNLFKHAKAGQVGMMPTYISPIFLNKHIRNDHVELLGLIPGPKQTHSVDMFNEVWYKEMSMLSEPFYEEVDGVTYCFKLVFVMFSGDYKHTPELSRRKQIPSRLACNTCHLQGSIPPELKRKVKKGKGVEKKEVEEGKNFFTFFQFLHLFLSIFPIFSIIFKKFRI